MIDHDPVKGDQNTIFESGAMQISLAEKMGSFFRDWKIPRDVLKLCSG